MLILTVGTLPLQAQQPRTTSSRNSPRCSRRQFRGPQPAPAYAAPGRESSDSSSRLCGPCSILSQLRSGVLAPLALFDRCFNFPVQQWMGFSPPYLLAAFPQAVTVDCTWCWQASSNLAPARTLGMLSQAGAPIHRLADMLGDDIWLIVCCRLTSLLRVQGTTEQRLSCAIFSGNGGFHHMFPALMRWHCDVLTIADNSKCRCLVKPMQTPRQAHKTGTQGHRGIKHAMQIRAVTLPLLGNANDHAAVMQ